MNELALEIAAMPNCCPARPGERIAGCVWVMKESELSSTLAPRQENAVCPRSGALTTTRIHASTTDARMSSPNAARVISTATSEPLRPREPPACSTRQAARQASRRGWCDQPRRPGSRTMWKRQALYSPTTEGTAAGRRPKISRVDHFLAEATINQVNRSGPERFSQ